MTKVVGIKFKNGGNQTQKGAFVPAPLDFPRRATLEIVIERKKQSARIVKGGNGAVKAGCRAVQRGDALIYAKRAFPSGTAYLFQRYLSAMLGIVGGKNF